MERLTGWDKNNAFFAKCFDEPCLGSGCRNDNCELNELVCTRLAEYEDLGVTPEQIKEIDKFYAEKCREVSELKKKLSKQWIPVSERLPEDGIYLVTCDDEEYPVKRMRLRHKTGIPIWLISCGIYDGRVFAWMPLPEPYKTE